MKIEIREATKPGYVQITSLDERWYENQETHEFIPSSSWISSYYPKGVEYFKWLASKGWNEAEQIKNEAGEKGSRVHKAIETLIRGEKVNMDDLYPDENGINREMTPDEWRSVMSFVDWVKEEKPEFISNEYTVIGEGYAGTVDIKCRLSGKVGIVDIKTSQDIWPSHELQLSSYKHADPECEFIAILQVGYRRNKKFFKFTELEDKFNLFLAAKEIWANENKNISPKQIEYPITLKL